MFAYGEEKGFRNGERSGGWQIAEEASCGEKVALLMSGQFSAKDGKDERIWRKPGNTRSVLVQSGTPGTVRRGPLVHLASLLTSPRML